MIMFDSALFLGVSALLLASGTTAQVVFNAADVSGALAEPNGAEIDVPTAEPDGKTLTRPNLTKKGNLVRLCGCSDEQPEIEEIRSISNKWLVNGNRISSHGFSNLVWSWGQFIDHDVVATVDGDDDLHPADIITLESRGLTAQMRLHRLISDGPSSCPSPVVVNTPQVDAGVVYSNEPKYLSETLRLPNSCMLRTSGSNMLPVSTVKDSKGNHVFLAGDARVDEHAVLTMMHTVWMREHNRLCEVMNKDAAYADMSSDAKFERARNVVIAKMQDITVREWLPLLGISESALRGAKPLISKPDISVEFSTAAYRFGHDMVPDVLGGVRTVDLFNGNAFYGIEKDGKADAAASRKIDDVALFAAQSRANEIDGKFSDTLRNTLFGAFGEDLGSRNIYRGRDMHIMDYSGIAKCYGVSANNAVYKETPMPFVGILRENKDVGGQVFGKTMRVVLTEQFHRIFFGKGGDWWESRLGDVAGFEDEIHAATIGSVINANTRSFIQSKAFLVGSGPSKSAPPGGSSPSGSDDSDAGETGDGVDGGDDGIPDLDPNDFPDLPPGFPIRFGKRGL